MTLQFKRLRLAATALCVFIFASFGVDQPASGQSALSDTTHPGPSIVKSLSRPDSASAHPGTPRRRSADSGSTALKPGDTLKAKKRQDLTDTVHYEADKIDYDARNKILRLCGHSKIRYQQMQLFADTLIYSTEDNLITASGNPELIEEKDTTVGDFMAYNIKTKRGRVHYATTHEDQAVFNGQRIIKTQKNELYVDEGEYTTCGIIDSPHYYFYAGHIRVVPDDKMICQPAILNIGDAPVAALPFFIFPVNQNAKSGILTPVWGGNPSSGGYVDHLGYYFHPNDYIDLLTSMRVQDFSQFMAEASTRYNDRYTLNGSIATQYTFNSNFLSSQREWSIDFTHNQNITPDGLTQLSGHGSLVSTSSFYSQYSLDSSQLQQQLITSNLSLTREFQDIKGSGSVIWNRTQDLSSGHISQDLPAVSFSLFDRPLIPLPSNEATPAAGTDTAAAKWYNNIYWGYSGRGVVHSEQYFDGINSSFLEPGLSNQVHISAPQKIFKYITISPNASANLSTFRGAIDTATISQSMVFDTISYVAPHISDTTLHSGFRTIPYANGSAKFFDTTLIDTNGTTDTSFGIREISITPTTISRHDTSKTLITNDFGWNAGASMSTNLYGILPIHILNFAGLRHTFSPTISYTYVPLHNLDKTFYPLGLSYEGAHPEQQLISYSLGNQFDGKLLKPSESTPDKPEEIKFPILTANVSGNYNFEATGRKFSDLGLTATTGYHFLGVSYNSDFWLYKNNDSTSITVPIIRSYSYNLSTGSFAVHGNLWDGDKILFDSLRAPDQLMERNAGPQAWHFSLTPAYSYSASRTTPGDVFLPTKTYNLSSSADLGFTRNWKISWSGNYNFITNQMVQNSINLACDLECWEMKFQWRPEKLNPGFYFIINVKKIPEIKWEQQNYN
jgi:lipopolysaccharide export system protein LptA